MVAEMVTAFRQTCALPPTRLTFVVDETDPMLQAYVDAMYAANEIVDASVYESLKSLDRYRGDPAHIHVDICQSTVTGMCAALNQAARYLVNGEIPAYAYAFMGDDHRPRSSGWDGAYLTELQRLGSGLVYGNDLLQGANLPTQVAMTSDVIRQLGHMAPDVLKHLYLDNYWIDLGRSAECIVYLPDVIVEHVHPAAGKTEMDDDYRRVNAAEMYEHDGNAYRKYIEDGFMARDVALIRSLRQEGNPDAQKTA